jgi:hypothetical protein
MRTKRFVLEGFAAATIGAGLLLAADVSRSDTPTAPDTQLALDERKQAILDQSEAFPEGRWTPRFYGTTPATSPPGTPIWRTRIVESTSSPYPSYSFQNHWQGYVDGVPTKVYAGSSPDGNPAVLLVQLDGGFFFAFDTAVAYELSTTAGSFRVSDFSGHVLDLSKGGAEHVIFDASTQRFLSADGDRELPSRVIFDASHQNTPTPAATPQAVGPAAIDVQGPGDLPNTSTALGPLRACASVSVGETTRVDVTISRVPQYNPQSGRGGIAGFGFNFQFDPAVVSVVDVNRGGNNETLIAAGGDRISFNFVDADGTNGPSPDPLPSESGNLRVEMADLSSEIESGEGVLVTLLLKATSNGASDLILSDVLILPAPTDARSYAVPAIIGSQVVVGSACRD